jgi:hypothetical protein
VFDHQSTNQHIFRNNHWQTVLSNFICGKQFNFLQLQKLIPNKNVLEGIKDEASGTENGQGLGYGLVVTASTDHYSWMSVSGDR